MVPGKIARVLQRCVSLMYLQGSRTSSDAAVDFESVPRSKRGRYLTIQHIFDVDSQEISLNVSGICADGTGKPNKVPPSFSTFQESADLHLRAKVRRPLSDP